MKFSRPLIFLSALCCLFISANSFAQCPVGVGPSFPSGCVSQYFTSITASGSGVVSTISYSAGSCIGTFFDNFSTQGVTAPTGSTVNISVSRVTGYLAYLAVYVDWNNNGTYETTELVGTVATMPSATASTIYSFAIPLIGITTNTNLHMRIFLGEPPSSGGPLSSINPPCSAKWGEAVDYYMNATCTTPTLAVSPASPGVCGPTGSVVLTASGAGATPTYQWSPATGLSGVTGTTVTSIPGITRTYTVTGYGPGVCLATTSVTVTVNPVVTPVITAGGPTSICPGSSVTLTETSGTGSVYQWYTGSTVIPGATDNNYTASPATSTTYSLSVTSAAGCVGSATQTVTVLTPPAAVITPAGATTVCSPATVLLNATFSPGYTYRWFNSTGAITGATNQAYTTGTAGTYSVEITSAAGCKDTSAGVTITINPSPVASASASGPLNFCSYYSITLTAVSTPGYTYQWYDGAAIIPGATNSTFTTSTVGTHDYRVKVTNGFGCSNTTPSGMFPVIVNPAPISTITASGPLSFCLGSNVTLSIPSVSGYTYQWYFGVTAATATPITTGGTSATYTTATSGYYYVKVTTPAGCTSNSSATPALVTVVTLPLIIHHTPLHICQGSHVDLSLGISSSAVGILFQWMRNSVDIPGATSSTYYATATGNYTCLVNVTGSCVGTTPSVSIIVNPRPDPIITYSGGLLRTGNFYTSYQWYKNYSFIAGATTNTLLPSGIADYSVIVNDSNGCVSEATNYPLNSIVLGTTQVAAESAPFIYPNPASDIVYVRYAHPLNIKISGADGRTLLESSASTGINISALNPGIYIVTLSDDEGNGQWIQKLIKH